MTLINQHLKRIIDMAAFAQSDILENLDLLREAAYDPETKIYDQLYLDACDDISMILGRLHMAQKKLKATQENHSAVGI